MRRLISLVGLALLGGCASMTPAGEQVRVTTNPEIVKGCEYLGEVKGADHMWGGAFGQGAAEKNAHKRLKNNAAEMGADTVLLATDHTGFSGSVKRGEAYRCR
jgi:hypothetical protein